MDYFSIKRIFYTLLMFGQVFVFSACSDKQSVKTMCREHPHICDDFQLDSWCKYELREWISNRYQVLTQQIIDDDENKYRQLMILDSYAQCMHKASQIKYIKYKEKEELRLKNYLKAKKAIAAIEHQTRNSENPYLLYYRWGRFNDQQAASDFILLEGTKALETSEMKAFLASYYLKSDVEKAISLYYQALEQFNDDNYRLNVDIFMQLTTLYIAKEKYQQGYIWSRVLGNYQQHNENLQFSVFEQFYRFTKEEQRELDKIADYLLDTIESGKFVSPRRGEESEVETTELDKHPLK